MNADIVDLRDFYASRLGQAAARSIGGALATLWSSMHEERLVGLGYALPYLDRFGTDAASALAFMPATQGAVNWPLDGASRTSLVDPADLPLPDSSIDRILMVHALEFVESPAAVLAEAFRVLAPGGRLVIVVPNRRGLWARLDRTPFGGGRPFSRGQAKRLLRDAMFTTSGFSEALLFPPFQREGFLNLAPALEAGGRRYWPVFSGVIVVEAVKLVYRGLPITQRERARIRRPRPVLVPQGAGVLGR